MTKATITQPRRVTSKFSHQDSETLRVSHLPLESTNRHSADSTWNTTKCSSHSSNGFHLRPPRECYQSWNSKVQSSTLRVSSPLRREKKRQYYSTLMKTSQDSPKGTLPALTRVQVPMLSATVKFLSNGKRTYNGRISRKFFIQCSRPPTTSKSMATHWAKRNSLTGGTLRLSARVSASGSPN